MKFLFATFFTVILGSQSIFSQSKPTTQPNYSDPKSVGVAFIEAEASDNTETLKAVIADEPSSAFYRYMLATAEARLALKNLKSEVEKKFGAEAAGDFFKFEPSPLLAEVNRYEIKVDDSIATLIDGRGKTVLGLVKREGQWKVDLSHWPVLRRAGEEKAEEVIATNYMYGRAARKTAEEIDKFTTMEEMADALRDYMKELTRSKRTGPATRDQ